MRLRKAYESLRESLNRPDGLELPSVAPSEATAAPEPEPTPVPKRPVRERAEPLAPDSEVPETIGRLMERVRTICRDNRLWDSLDAWPSLIFDSPKRGVVKHRAPDRFRVRFSQRAR